MSNILILIFSTLIFLILSSVYRVRRFLYLASKIPSPKGQIPFIGGSLLFLRAGMNDIMSIIKNVHQKIGSQFLKIWFGVEIIIPVLTPELTKQVLTAKECNHRAKFAMEFFNIPYSITHGNFERGKHHRSILNTVLGTQLLNKIVSTFDEKSKKFTNSFKTYCDKEAFDIYPHSSAFFLETILNVQMDLNINLINHVNKFFVVQQHEK